MAFEKELQACQDNLSKLLNRAHGGEINLFRGLEFFDAEHAPFFHGRTKTARKVLDVLEKQAAEKKPFVLVLGPDGSGKTSLVRAGILPVLTQIGIIERGSSWRLALARPADRGSGNPFTRSLRRFSRSRRCRSFRMRHPLMPGRILQQNYEKLRRILHFGSVRPCSISACRRRIVSLTSRDSRSLVQTWRKASSFLGQTDWGESTSSKRDSSTPRKVPMRRCS